MHWATLHFRKMFQSPSKKAGRGGTGNKRGAHHGAPSPDPLGSSPSASSFGFALPQFTKRGNMHGTPQIIKDSLPVRLFSQNTHDSSGLFANASSCFGGGSSPAKLPASHNPLQHHPISRNPLSNLQTSSGRNQATFDGSFANGFQGTVQSFYNGNGPSPPATSANHHNEPFSNPMDVNGIRSCPPLFSPATATPPEIEFIVKRPNCDSQQLHHGKKQTSLVDAPANLWCYLCQKSPATMTMGNSLLASASSSDSHRGNGCSIRPSCPSLAPVLGHFPQGFHQSPNLNLQVPLTLTPTSSDATGQQDANRNQPEKERREQIRDVKVGQNVVKDVPKSHGVCKIHFHEQQRKNHEELLRNGRMLQQQLKDVSSLESRFCLGEVASACPDTSSPKFQALHAHSVSHFLNHTPDFKINNKGSRVPFDNILWVAPKKSTISNAVSWAATPTCIIVGDLLEAKAKGVSICCGSDEVDDTLVVTMSFNNPESGEIEQLHIASEPSEGTGEGSADAVMHALKRVQIQEEGETERTGLRGQVGDSGGGGTAENLAGNIKSLELRCPHLAYFIANCCEHDGANAFAHPFKQCLGEGSLDKINPLQTCHSCWHLQECFDADTFRAMWIAAKKQIGELKAMQAAQEKSQLDNQ